ncbi:MAG: GxxExxY protein [Rubripirellula sp.]
MNDDELNALTEKIIGCAYQVSNTLGSGFLEKVYENALAIELRKNGLRVMQQAPIKVLYDANVVGEYFADLLVSNVVIVELKAVSGISDVFAAQCLNYLKATGLPICLLLNFGKPRIEVKRYRL